MCSIINNAVAQIANPDLPAIQAQIEDVINTVFKEVDADWHYMEDRGILSDGHDLRQYWDTGEGPGGLESDAHEDWKGVSDMCATFAKWYHSNPTLLPDLLCAQLYNTLKEGLIEDIMDAEETGEEDEEGYPICNVFTAAQKTAFLQASFKTTKQFYSVV